MLTCPAPYRANKITMLQKLQLGYKLFIILTAHDTFIYLKVVFFSTINP
jgi:hypothetical protein